MALTHGPRLGSPSSTGFTVWLRFDALATCELQARVAGATAWTTRDTVAVDATRDNTVVLTATGLTANTKYEYRVLADSVEVAASSTWTMPPARGGRFVIYWTSDFHDTDPTTAMQHILADFEANYEPQGIPAFVHQGGDLWGGTLAADPTLLRNIMDDAVYVRVSQISGVGKACARLPLAYMWDDWDFAGNNSSKYSQLYFTSEPDPYAAALQAWDWAWRDHPQPIPPNYSYVLDVAGVPLIVLDNRSERTHRVGVLANASTGLLGDEPLSDTITAIGVPTRTWLRNLLRSYKHTRGLMLMQTCTTFVDGARSIQGAAARDSIGVSFRAERNYVMEALRGAGPSDTLKLVVLSGDDHRTCAFSRQLGAPANTTGPIASPPPTWTRTGTPIGVWIRELKVSSAAGVVSGTIGTFGVGDLYDLSSEGVFVQRLDITSTRGGAQVTMIGSLINALTGALHDTYTYYENGTMVVGSYSAARQPVEQSQLWPVDNLKGGVTFSRGYEDAISGVIDRRKYMSRDHLWRLRVGEDIDALDRDEYRRLNQRRIEAPPRAPSD